jgi:hypothetical protein
MPEIECLTGISKGFELEFVEREATPEPLMKLSIHLHTAGSHRPKYICPDEYFVIMNRRAVVIGIGTAFTAGCIGNTDIPNRKSDGEDEEPTEAGIPDSTYTPNRQPVADARWVEEAPDELDPQSTSEPPIAEYDSILKLFDRAIEQEEWEPPEDRDDQHTPDKSAGEPVSRGLNEETYESLQDDLEDYEYWDDGDYPGRYFDHKGTIVALDVGKPE